MIDDKMVMSFVMKLKLAASRAEEPDECVFCLSAEKAEELLPALEKASELLGYWCAMEKAQIEHMEDLADKASY